MKRISLFTCSYMDVNDQTTVSDVINHGQSLQTSQDKPFTRCAAGDPFTIIDPSTHVKEIESRAFFLGVDLPNIMVQWSAEGITSSKLKRVHLTPETTVESCSDDWRGIVDPSEVTGVRIDEKVFPKDLPLIKCLPVNCPARIGLQLVRGPMPQPSSTGSASNQKELAEKDAKIAELTRQLAECKKQRDEAISLAEKFVNEDKKRAQERAALLSKIKASGL